MTIVAGTLVGSYKILSPLGAGGMGEVWLAEDTRLKRKVALKLLPAELTADVDTRHNFNRKAHQPENRRRFSILTRK
jgi:serine/threonine-protein kinase